MGDHPGPLEAEIGAARDLCVLADPVQLDLIADEVPGRHAGTAVAVERGRGRPPGALNKRSAKFRDQILSMGPHPALALQRAYSTPLPLLAAQLGCTLYEAAQLAIRAAAELLPYIEGKQPITVDMRQRHDVVLIMGGTPGAPLDGGELEALADDVNRAGEAIDWGTATFEEAAAEVPRLSEPQRDAPESDAD